MNFSAIAALTIAILANCAANLLVKKACAYGSGLALYLNPYFLSGVALFGVNLVAYTFSLKAIPLTVVYPILVGGSLFCLSIFAHFGLGEALTWPRIAGMALIVSGVTLVVR
jgi:multidrug transporter EmrE-like cation transporter